MEAVQVGILLLLLLLLLSRRGALFGVRESARARERV